MEVDAFDSGVGTVLSQRKASSGKLKPCAFFSKKLSSAEQNYEFKNRELLAIKLALEEWHHWLEGAAQPFIILTDHKNLAFFRSAKRLNSCQAHCCLFFYRFNFIITYRPGIRNVKPDALSRQFNSSDNCTVSPILSPSCIEGTLTWEIETRVRQAQGEEPNHVPCPAGTLFVPSSLRSDVLTWGHTSHVFCHAGIHRTPALLSRRFFWPSVEKDLREYIAACCTYLCSKSSNSPPSGLLHPLSTPGRPWLHITLDFVTGLPPSHGNTVIHTVIDRFSKSAYFISLPQLSTAMETANNLVSHVFHYHGIPADIVSNQGQ